MSKVLLVDAYNMIHRARFGFGSGPHSVTFNFFRALRSEINRHLPNKVYIVSDRDWETECGPDPKPNLAR